MINCRKIEDIKVIIRKNEKLYKIAKIIYSPILFKKYLQMIIFAHKRAREVIVLLNSVNNRKKYIYYFGIPTHKNLGDAAQLMCIRKWIYENYDDFTLIEIETMPTYVKKLRNKLIETIKESDIIITESGATFSDCHNDHLMHRFLLKEFKNTKILMMPETINFSSDKELDITAKLFNSNKKSLLLARDIVSYNMVIKAFDYNRVALYPDIVTTLIGNYDLGINDGDRDGILVCKRIDGEKKYSDMDIVSFVKFLKRSSSVVNFTDTDFEKSYEYTMAHINEEIKGKIEYFGRHKIVVTDRFHGMIFALIANIPVIVLPTIGHKVYEGAKWFSDIYPESIFFCNNLLEAENKILELLKNNHKVTNMSWSKEEYFDGLKDFFMSTICNL